MYLAPSQSLLSRRGSRYSALFLVLKYVVTVVSYAPPFTPVYTYRSQPSSMCLSSAEHW